MYKWKKLNYFQILMLTPIKIVAFYEKGKEPIIIRKEQKTNRIHIQIWKQMYQTRNEYASL